MTTIVYCHKTKQIACDSRSTVGCTIESDETDKFIFLNDEMWFFCGSRADNQKLIDMHNEDRPVSYVECFAIVANTKGVFCRIYDTEKNKYMPYELTCSWAVGSGTDHALTALDMGGSVKRAVEMAIKRDCYTGGKIKVFDCAKMEFIE